VRVLRQSPSLKRGGVQFARLGVQVLPQLVPDITLRSAHWTDRWPAFCDLVLETCKIAYYQVRGWI
jgi:hypothetical protein